jgi:flagellin
MLSLSTIQHSTLASRVSFYQKEVNAASDRISTGSKLNTSWEAPAAFSVAETYRTQVSAARSVSTSLQDAVNIVRIGEDGIRSIVEVTQSMRDLVMQAANGTNTQENLDFYQTSLDTLRGLVIQSYNTAKDFRVSFEGNSEYDRKLTFMVGTRPTDTMEVDYNPLRTGLRDFVMGLYGYREIFENPDLELFLGAFGIYPAPQPDAPVPPPLLGPGEPPGTTWEQKYPKKIVINDPTKLTGIQDAFALVDSAKEIMLKQETYLGTISQRLEIHLSVVQKFEASISQAESTLRDADLAAESTKLTKSQVLQQASQAMLIQANNRLAQVLELIRGN